MKSSKVLISAILLTTSLSVSAEERFEAPSIADTIVNGRINQLQQEMDYNSPMNQNLRMQKQANEMQREQMDYERSRNDEADYRRGTGYYK